MASRPGILETPLSPNEVRLPRNNGHTDNFLECVRTRRKTICDIDVAHRSASFMFLGGIVEKLGRPLEWDPVKETFPNDDEAGRMLSNAYRPPWQV